MLWDHWVMGKDGSPENPKADPKCETCKGHGVVEDGEFHYFSVLIDCPKCIPKKNLEAK